MSFFIVKTSTSNKQAAVINKTTLNPSLKSRGVVYEIGRSFKLIKPSIL
jgi:hypothetical protein